MMYVSANQKTVSLNLHRYTLVVACWGVEWLRLTPRFRAGAGAQTATACTSLTQLTLLAWIRMVSTLEAIK
jgi:hypothetical protein